MLLLRCDACGERQLVGTRSVLALADTDHGPEALVRCLRGHDVAWSPRADTFRVLGAVEVAA